MLLPLTLGKGRGVGRISDMGGGQKNKLYLYRLMRAKKFVPEVMPIN